MFSKFNDGSGTQMFRFLIMRLAVSESPNSRSNLGQNFRFLTFTFSSLFNSYFINIQDGFFLEEFDPISVKGTLLSVANLLPLSLKLKLKLALSIKNNLMSISNKHIQENFCNFQIYWFQISRKKSCYAIFIWILLWPISGIIRVHLSASFQF